MNKLIIAFTFFITLGSNLTAQNNTSSLTEEQQQSAKDIAVQWVSLLTAGEDVTQLLEISTTPFSLDDKNILKSTEELIGFYNKVISNKGKREVPKITNKIINAKDLSTENPIPENTLITEITIHTEDRNHIIFVFVDVSKDKYLVVGFIN